MRVAVLLLATLGLAGCPSEDPPPDGSLPEASSRDASSPDASLPEPRALLELRCTGCHELDWVCGPARSEAAWVREMARMRAYGAELSAEEEEILVRWLTDSGELAEDCGR